MADLVSTILSVFKADTSDMKSKVKELSGIEKQAAQERLKAMEDSNKGLESYIKTLTKVGSVLLVVKEAFDGAALSIEESRLQTAAAGTDIDALDKSFGGLVDRIGEYRFAATLHNSGLKVTQQETLAAANAIRGMHRAGIDLAEATQRVTDVLTKGESTALREYGIVVDEAKYATDAFGNRMDEQTKRVLISHDALQQLTKKYGDFDGAQQTTGENLESTQVKMKQSVEDLKEAFGKLVIALAPAIAGLAKVVEGIAKVVEFADKLSTNDTFLAFAGFQTGAIRGAIGDAQEAVLTAQGKNAMQLFTRGLGRKIDEAEQALAQKAADDAIAAVTALTASKIRSMKKPGSGKKAGPDLLQIGSYDSAATLGISGIATSTSLGAAADSRSLDEYGNDALLGKTDALLKEAQDAANQKRESFLESLFGKPEEFQVYQQLFEGVTNGVSSAYEAIVTGSEPAGKAFKKAIAEQMLAIGKSEAVLAIKESAWAIGELAMGNIPGATAHATSAAEHAAAALAAGVVAKELGAGGSTAPSKSSGGASAGGSSGSGTGGNAQPGNGPIVIIGEAFDQSTPRQRQIKAKQLVTRALGNSAVEEG